MMLPSVWPSVQLLVEIVALVVEVQDAGIMDEEREGTAHQRRVVANHNVQKLAVIVRKCHEEVFHGFGGSKNGRLRERSAANEPAGGRGFGSNVLAYDHEAFYQWKEDGSDVIQLRSIYECQAVTQFSPQGRKFEGFVNSLDLLGTFRRRWSG